MPADLVDGVANDEFLQESIWRVLRRCKNADPVESRISIKAAAATAEVARWLGLEPGAPVLNHEVQIIGDDGRVTILGSTLYHPERFIYSTRVQRRRLAPGAEV
jgi:GntR family transcriptional regulator